MALKQFRFRQIDWASNRMERNRRRFTVPAPSLNSPAGFD